MRASVTWINDYLDPPADMREQATALTRAGFPDEGEFPVENGEQSQDFEMTSNRGDCLCHVALAREIAVITGRTLKEPTVSLPATGPAAKTLLSIHNDEPTACPLYTGRIITGVRVAESPKWLKKRLEAIGLVPRNNIVDATNFVLFELGQPTHVFDLAKLAGPEIRIRKAAKGEMLLPIGEGATAITLTPDDLVIGDRDKPVALAGVKGGAATAVDEMTVDLLLEAASFDPVCVRSASRRHQIASDSSYRFERGVHPADVNNAAERLASLIIDLAGGELADGVLVAGQPIPPPRVVSLRPDRCRDVLGIDISTDSITARLAALGLNPKNSGGKIQCTIPPRRLDLEREIDLVEEVGRTEGYDLLPINDQISIRAVEPNPTAGALHAMRSALVGLGFIETVTHSLVSLHAAKSFCPDGAAHLAVDEERAGAEPVLRPSLAPSLLRVLRHNHDHGVHPVQVFETGAVWKSLHDNAICETRVLGLACDPPAADPTAQGAFGAARIAIERVVRNAGGKNLSFEPCEHAWLAPAAHAVVDGEPVGFVGMLDPNLASALGHDKPVAVAEVEFHPEGLAERMSAWPPESQSRPLASFPAIDRDLSIIVTEDTSWSSIEKCVLDANPEMLDRVEFKMIYRGKTVGEGMKSVTLRLRFRAEDRTLRHEEVDPNVAAIQQGLSATLHAEIRD